MNPPTRAIIVIGLALGGCRGGEPAQQPPADDTTVAVNLLAQAGVTVDRSAVQRVLRDSLETVIWIEPRVQGLPVLDRLVGYVFESDSGAPQLLGDVIPDVLPGVAERPRVTLEQARAAFYREAAQAQWTLTPDDPLRATLGFVQGPPGRPYVLAWRVRPLSTTMPVVVIDAESGGVLFKDSGIRCSRAPCP